MVCQHPAHSTQGLTWFIPRNEHASWEMPGAIPYASKAPKHSQLRAGLLPPAQILPLYSCGAAGRGEQECRAPRCQSQAKNSAVTLESSQGVGSRSLLLNDGWRSVCFPGSMPG